MTRAVRFFVEGEPLPKGSMRAFMPRGGRFPVVTNDSPKTKPWQMSVTAAVAAQGASFESAPVCVELTFYFRRPKGHFGKKGLLASAPKHPAKKPDLDKCVRLILDAITNAGSWVDDAQVIDITARKRFADQRTSGVEILIREEVADV